MHGEVDQSFVPVVIDGQARRPESKSASPQSSVELEIGGVIVRIGRDASTETIVAALCALKVTA